MVLGWVLVPARYGPAELGVWWMIRSSWIYSRAGVCVLARAAHVWHTHAHTHKDTHTHAHTHKHSQGRQAVFIVSELRGRQFPPPGSVDRQEGRTVMA